jgi:hypothetical protein
MDVKRARAVVVSGAIALVIAGVVILLMKWKAGAKGLIPGPGTSLGSGSGSGSWLSAIGIPSDYANTAWTNPAYAADTAWTNPAYAADSYPDYDSGPGSGVGVGVGVGSGRQLDLPAVPRLPVRTIELGDLPSIRPEDQFGVPIGDSQFTTPARAKGFEDTAQALKDGAFSDERVMPSLSTKNGGMLSTLDVRGDYAAPVLFDPSDRTCGSCDKQCVLDGKWNQSSAQRNIDLGIVKEERRRRIVFADE